MLFASLFRQVRRWRGFRRHTHGYFWIVRWKDDLAFLVTLGLPAVAVAGIVYFAYVDGACVRHAHARAVEQEASADGRAANELRCLAENTYFEARGEPIEGQ